MDFLVTPKTSNLLIDCYSCYCNNCYGTDCDCNGKCTCNAKSCSCNLNVNVCPRRYCDNKTCTIKADIANIP